MSLLKVGIEGILKGSGAVKYHLFDVHPAFLKNLLQLIIGQTIFRLSCNDFWGQWIKPSHTPTHILN